MARRRRRSASYEVELNLAAMLDMAFQLLTFFILTFRPAPIEGQITLRLPPPQPIANVSAKEQAGADTSRTDPVQGVDTLTISVFANAQGKIAAMAVGDAQVGSIARLDEKLQSAFGDPLAKFEQVVIQVGSDLRYEELMKIVEVCTRQKLPDGKTLSKLSFVEVPNG